MFTEKSKPWSLPITAEFVGNLKRRNAISHKSRAWRTISRIKRRVEAGRDRGEEIVFAVRMGVSEGWKRGEVRINDILSRGIASPSGRSFFSRACARSDAIHIESFNKKFCSPAESAPFCEFKWKSARGGGEPLGVGRRQRIGDGWQEGLLACKLKCCHLNANKTPESSSARTSGRWLTDRTPEVLTWSTRTFSKFQHVKTNAL